MKERAGVECFFEQIGEGSCGVCVTNVILKMWDKPGAIFRFYPDKGVSSKKILWILRRAGLDARPKIISIRNLKPRSILWYPFKDHYVVVGEIADGRAHIYDSEKKGPYWCRLSILKKKWYKLYSGRWRGWVIETKKRNSKK